MANIASLILQNFNDSDLKIASLSKLKEYISFCINKDLKERIKYKSEHHHLLMKSLFPEYKNLSQNPWNGVHLLHRDHYIAHSLLAEAIDSHKVSSAWGWMNEINTKTGKISEPQDIIGPERYATLRSECTRKHAEHITKEYIDENGDITTVALQRGKKNSETVSKEYIDEDGEVTSISKERAIKTANSMMKEYIDKNGTKTTKANIRANTAAEKMNKKYINENGEVTSIYKESGKKCSETKNKEYLNENGILTTIKKEAAILHSKTMREKGKKFDLYHIHLGLLVERIPMAELRMISQVLNKKTKENYLGKDIRTRTKLTKVYKSLLIGLYTKEIKEK